MSTDITLYHYWRSSCSWRVRWAFLHKGVTYKDKPINLLAGEHTSPAFLAVNPSGYLPAIQVPEGTFGESMAIMEWIEETWPKKPLLPASPIDRMRVRQMCLSVIAGTQPIQNLSVMRKHSNNPQEQQAWAKHWISLGLEKLETLVRDHAGTYCFGGNLTMADLCLVPQMYNANRFGIDTAAFPTLHRINQTCLMNAECIKAAPQNQPGATA